MRCGCGCVTEAWLWRCGCERCGCGRCGYGGVAVGGVTVVGGVTCMRV